jgi:uncharacterized protein YeaO (DUF488 family)
MRHTAGSATGEAIMSGVVRLKRAYAPAAPDDGVRVLVDRIWPRGLSRAQAHVDLWLQEVAPASELRKWFGHRPDRWSEFRRRYLAALDANPALGQLRDLAERGDVTLLFAAKDEARNNAVVLAERLAK